MENNYYTYVWFNVETLENFYVGMGTGLRRFEIKKRNFRFNRYFQSNNCAVRLYKTGLFKDEARQLEIELMAQYYPCCNLTRGGEYSNGKKISEALKGRTLSKQHKISLSVAGKESWKYRDRAIHGKRVAVLNKEKVILKEFEAKYKVG